MKRKRADNENSSKARYKLVDNPRFKKRFTNQSPSTIQRVYEGKESISKTKEDKGRRRYVEKSPYAKCCNKNERKCVVAMGNCYGCGKTGHMKRDFSMMKDQGRENAQAQVGAPNPDSPKENTFNVLHARGEQAECPDVVTSIFQVFSIEVNALVYLGATLLSIIPRVARTFDVLSDILSEPFLATTIVCYSTLARSVFRICPITLPNRVTLVHLVEIDMVDFDVVLKMDFLHASFDSIYCRTRVVKFQFQSELVLILKGGNTIPRVLIIL